ncbi:MAG: RecQ family ATP-dependent DNA helicase [Planctomycetota bacterium]|nr:RecQ family ATP-dependent DNA helicase [Planctomycetota bacterium]
MNPSLESESLGVLRRRFGYEQFRSTQQQIINRTLAGGDSLVIMPTGGGKSLCFQIPALVIAQRYLDQPLRDRMRPPLTLVLSPLIALMKDQVDALQAKGIEATFVNSSLDRDERTRRYRQIAEGNYSLLYVTPERFRKEEFVAVLQKREIKLLAVDEAHCISEWGHDFRPDYTRVGDFRKELGSPTTIALTATATRDVQIDIIRQLNIPAFGNEIGQCQLFHEGIQRPNLALSVREVWGLDEKVQLLRQVVERWPNESGIVYFTLIRSLDEMSERLRKLGIEHVCYHGDLSRNDRRRIQNGFMQNRCPLVLATNAFGMGIDKEDIRYVLHAEVPGSMESYYQEIGRAGRDGLPSECTLMYDQRDLNTQVEFLRWSNPDADFYERTYDLLLHDVDSVRAFGMEWLRERLCDRQKRDRRLETVLAMLQRFGVIEDEMDLTNIEIQGSLPSTLADQEDRADKLLRDQKKLYALVEYSKSEDPRAYIHEYFSAAITQSMAAPIEEIDVV